MYIRKSIVLGALFALTLVSCQFSLQPTGNVVLGFGVGQGKSLGSPISATVTVDGPDIAPLVWYISPNAGNVSLPIPSGADRKLTVTLTYPASTSSFIREKSGSAVFSLAPLEKKTVTINTSFSKSAIVVGDSANGRLVQLENMGGTGWTTMAKTVLGYSTQSFFPVGMDFDGDGNLYLTDYANSNGVFKIKGIDGNGLTQLASGNKTSGLAIDKTRKILYFSTSLGSLYSLDLSVATPTPTLVLPTTFNVGVELYSTSSTRPGWGLAVDDSGNVFFTGYLTISSIPHPYLARINPFSTLPTSLTDTAHFQIVQLDTAAGGSYLNSATLPTNQGMQLKVQNGFLYLAGLSASSALPSAGVAPFAAVLLKIDPKVFDQSSIDLGQASAFGFLSYSLSTDLTTNMLWGARQFAATFGRHLVLQDKSLIGFASPINNDRLFSIDDNLSAASIETYGQYGSGTGQFDFLETIYAN